MNYAVVRNLLGKILIFLGMLMLIPLIFCIVYKEELINYLAFIIPAFASLSIGCLFNIKKASNPKILVKEGLVIVGLSWIAMSLFGCIPYLISGLFDNFFDAFFEITSGFTTTGASVLSDIEGVLYNNHSIFFWRSFTHWIGGMGILVFILAIIPESDEGSSVHILRAESPGPQVGRLVTRMRASSRILYIIYFALTLIMIFFLTIGPDQKMGLYESIIYTLGTAGTGGFGVDNASLAEYAAYSQYVISIFMILFGINFSLFYFILIGNFKDVVKNDEIKCYFLFIITSVIIIFISIHSKFNTIEEAFRTSLFQVASIISTTGYSTVDFASWPTISLMVIIILMIAGSCAGSTAGGVKNTRIVILIKSAVNKIKNMISPRKVDTIKMDGKSVSNDIIHSVYSFILVYCLIVLAGAIVVSCDPWINNSSEIVNVSNYSGGLIESFSASLTCVSNVGPGLGAIGPMNNFSEFSGFTKLFLSLEMMAGRLELFPLLILFSPKTWSRKRM